MAGSRVVQAIGPSAQLADRKSSVQRSVNLYLSQIESIGEDKQFVLESAPGLVSFLTMAADLRGSYDADGRWFVVAGSTLYEIVGGSAVSRGTLASVSGYVSMIHGSNQLQLVDGASGYVLTLATNVFAQITAPGWLGSNWTEHIDGYFIWVDPGSEIFYISAIDDATNLNALDFSSADVQPDNIVTHRAAKRELYLMGRRSIEVWVNNPGGDFPFVRYNSTPIDVGVVGTRAACIAADSLVWVGRTKNGQGYVYAMQGYQPRRISTQAVEQAITASTDLSLCSMWTYHVGGHEFVGINAPGMQSTWVYDFATQQWHERAEMLSGEYIPLRVDQVTFHEGAHYAAANEKVYAISKTAYTLDGDIMPRRRTWPHLVSPAMEPVSYRGLELACTTGSEVAGNITLEISNDGGSVFGPPLIRSLGAVGRRMQKVRWHMLGSSEDRVFSLNCTDPVPLTLHACNLDAS